MKEITDRTTDIEFHMLTVNLDGKQKKYEKVGEVHVHRINTVTVGKFGKYFFTFASLPKALSLHRKHQFCAIWSIMASYSGFAALFFKILRPGIPLILTLQEGDPFEYTKRRTNIFYPLFVQIFRRATIVQSISHYLAGLAKKMGYKGEIHVIPNGVDVPLFTTGYSEQELGALRWELHKETDDVFLVTTSRLVVKNGLADVIKALPLLSDRVKFLILGIGELEHELRTLAHDLGVEKRVMFAGFIPYKEIPKYLHISDIFIRPSLSEGMGNSFIEAMALGIPVVATPVGGIPDFLKDQETGLFCKVHDPESIAKAVNKLIDDPALCNKLITNGRTLALSRYDWNDIARDMREKVFKIC